MFTQPNMVAGEVRVRRPCGKCLLCLPAELRNKIYDFVLTTNYSVVCAPTHLEDRTVQRFYILEKKGVIYHDSFNPLKFVCKQLYFETNDLIPNTPCLIFPIRFDKTECASVTTSR